MSLPTAGLTAHTCWGCDWWQGALGVAGTFLYGTSFFFLVWFSVKTLVSPCHSSLCASSFHWRARGSTAAMSKLLRCICSSSEILFQRGACRKNPGRRNFRTFSALWDENASKGRNYYLKLPDLFSYFPLWPWPTYCPCFRFFLCPLLKTQSIARDFGQDLTLERHS